MASTVWKGFLTFGLVSIPVKLSRAARPEKVSFRQLVGSTGNRVRQALMAAPGTGAAPTAAPREEVEDEPEIEEKSASPTTTTAPFLVPRGTEPEDEEPREVSRSELVKGFEYAKDQYVTISKEELAQITPQTAREMQILEFVKLDEVEPVYFETSYYVSPDKGGEKAYSLLFAALRQSGFVGVAQLAMHNREHVVILRPGRHGIILHTMFYETEIRQDDEYRAVVGEVSQKELDLAMMLVNSLEAPFEPAKYHDSYKERVDALIQAKIAGQETVAAPAPKPSAVVNILEALQKSLEASGRKPPARAVAETPAAGKRSRKKA